MCNFIRKLFEKTVEQAMEPEKEKEVFDKDHLNSDYKLGGCFGCHIQLSDPERFPSWNGEGTIRVWGHQPRIPKPGQTLVGEFQKTFIKFRFVMVDPCYDPPDMFFATVEFVDQFVK